MGTDIDGGSRASWRNLEAEDRQRKADEARAETLYVAKEYKVFLLTRQGGDDDSRKAYISIKPFGALSDKALAELTAKAVPWEPDASNIRAIPRGLTLAFYDGITKTESLIYIGELDRDVRTRLRFNRASEKGWDKYADMASSPVAIDETIRVSKPLTFTRKSLSA